MMLKSIVTLAITAAVALSCAAADNNKTKIPYTSFQTPTGYFAQNDIRTGAVIVYSDAKDRIQTWLDKGYLVQTMYGFRTGDDYIKNHKDECQTLADGTLHTCGPGSYYMVPTPSRIKAAVDYFTNAINNGTSAVIPEEPEFFACTGYSESFKKAWKDYYKEPWQDPASTIQARYKSERLKAQMEYNQVKAIMDAAKAQKESVRRMVACHSPVSYHSWGIIYPHYQCLSIPSLQEIIGQVWTGTARSSCRYEGINEERTFENAFLEYSSLYNLARGTGKRMWFLMDPLEDNPDRSMEDYNTNYVKTLVASLLFPEVDSYEVMPWPTRIFGRVPDPFATEIMSIVNALDDIHNQKSSSSFGGTQGIATLVADSMGWQRGEPNKSNFDSFYGITLPLVMKGVPIQVAQLERTPDKDYLKPYKALLVSYDILKPMSPKYNQAIADWVKQGGVLVFFGGTDAYNDIPEWWKKRGFASPQADLYARLGVPGKLSSVSAPQQSAFKELGREKERITTMANDAVYKFDLSQFTKKGDPVLVRFRDAYPGDGWGPAVTSVKLTVDGSISADFNTGTSDETEYLFDDNGSAYNGKYRFADADQYFTYRFDIPKDSSASLEVKVGDQFVVEATSAPAIQGWTLLQSAVTELTRENSLIHVPSRFPLTLCAGIHDELYHEVDKLGSVAFEQKVGKGALIHVGISPAYFASSYQSANQLRAIISYACTKAGLTYKESDGLGIRRGKYVAIRMFDGEKSLKGSYINLLDPTLPVMQDPSVESQDLAFFCDVTNDLSGAPKLLYSSSKVEKKTESTDAIELNLSGPIKTKGTARIFTAGKVIDSVQPESVKQEQSGNTVLLTYDNQPEGVGVTVRFK